MIRFERAVYALPEIMTLAAATPMFVLLLLFSLTILTIELLKYNLFPLLTWRVAPPGALSHSLFSHSVTAPGILCLKQEDRAEFLLREKETGGNTYIV